jgi:predicted phosphodiesterase
MHGASSAVRGLVQCGADVILSGHLHSWRAEPSPSLDRDAGSVLLVQAGTGLSSRLRGGGNDYNVLHVESGTVTIRRFATSANGLSFRCVEERHFVRHEGRWSA